MDRDAGLEPAAGWRRRLYVIIFRHDTPAGKAFDVTLLAIIGISVIAVLLESIAEVRDRFASELLAVEWVFTILFTIEYVLRLICVNSPRRYALSFLGIVDLLAVLPTYLSLFLGGAQALIVIRALRLLRVFRVLKLPHYLGEATYLAAALRASRQKITVFLFTVLTLVLIVGALMYLIEGPERGFTSIPVSIYWTIVTLTTVGYGDIAPQTPLGRVVAAAVMLTGYGIIAVPTGIVTAELVAMERKGFRARSCGRCGAAGHDTDARHCKYCGASLDHVEERERTGPDRTGGPRVRSPLKLKMSCVLRQRTR